MLFTTLFLIILLACLWSISDATLATRLVLTLMCVASFGLLSWSFGAFITAHAGLIAIIGVKVFGVEWLNQRVR